MSYSHVTAMRREAVDLLNCRPGKVYIDGTLGGSGHARLICEKIIPGGLLIGIDQDRDAIIHAKNTLKPYGTGVLIFHDNYVNLGNILEGLNLAGVDGILLDLGISLHQLQSSGRGFSFNCDEPLDMRMNTMSTTTADELIHTLREKELEKIFRTYGEERWARLIARRIVQFRNKDKISSSRQLAEIVCDAVPKKFLGRRRIHPATRVFMALRIAVNNELDILDRFMKNAANLLNPEGRICVLSFHSLEDRIVKNELKKLEKGCICPPDLPVCVCHRKPVVRILTKKPMRPNDEEVRSNPMARSTRLRAAEKL